MNVLIVLAHHEPKSFNGALAAAARTTLEQHGHQVEVSDLYASAFTAVADRADFTGAANPAYLKYQSEQRAAWNGGAADGFAPDIRREQQRLLDADLVIFQFPLYWFSVPAILKGWFDRVLATGFAYGGGRWFETAPLCGRRALLSITMGAQEDRWGDDKLFGSMEHILWPLHVGTLNFCGFEVLAPFISFGAASKTDEAREQLLERWTRRLVTIEAETPLPFRRAADYADKSYRG